MSEPGCAKNTGHNRRSLERRDRQPFCVLFPCDKEGSLTEEILEKSKERPGTDQRKKLLLEQITAYVDTHLTEKLTLKQIAAHCGVSVSTVTQLFQKKASTTFHDFVTLRRMNTVEKLIREGMPLEQAGKEAGYRDHSTFYRAFRREFGLSPREYRMQLFTEERE